jgi:hypothetical protein
MRRSASQSLRDAATGQFVMIGPDIDEPRVWTEYCRRHPDRRYAVAKRRLSKMELRQRRLHNQALREREIDSSRSSERLKALK